MIFFLYAKSGGLWETRRGLTNRSTTTDENKLEDIRQKTFL